MGSNSDRPLSFTDDQGRLSDPKRLRRLLDTGLLDTGGDASFDRLARLAATLTGSAVSVVSLVEEDRQVFPGAYGLPAAAIERRSMPLSHSFCHYVVMNDAALIVDDVRQHPVLSESPSLRDFGVMAYAGVPVHGPDGDVLGAFCVVERNVVEWQPEQLAILQDLADSVETELALRLRTRDVELASARLHQAIDGAAHTGFIAADRDGVITVVNRAAEELLGARAEDVVGIHTLSELPKLYRTVELVTPALPCGDSLLALGPAPDAHRGPDEWMVEDDLGIRRIVSVRVTVLRDRRGKKDGYVLVATDVTAHHQTQAALQDVIEKQTDAVDRLIELDRARYDFIATASHELRTPVTSILGFTELLTEGAAGELSPTQARLIDRVDRNGKRLLDLVEDLLNLSEVDTGGAAALQRVSLDAATPGVRAWRALKPMLKGRQLQADLLIERDLPSVHGDVVQLERAIRHLLANAVKFTPDGGSIQLAIRRQGSDVVFEITDSGVGIEEDEQAELFDPFFRTREALSLATPGAGLGLAVVRGIVDAHGAEIEVCSRRDVGTTVRIRVPVPLRLERPAASQEWSA